MNLFTRVKDVIAADLHRLLDEKEKKNPEAMLNQFIRNCESEVKKVEGLVKRQTEAAAKYLKERDEAALMAKKREHQTDIALHAKEADLEKQAREEALYYNSQVDRLTDLYDTAKNDEASLLVQLDEMRLKLKEMHERRLELTGKAGATSAKNDSIGSGVKNSFAAVNEQFDRLEEMLNEVSFDEKMEQLERDLKAGDLPE